MCIKRLIRTFFLPQNKQSNKESIFVLRLFKFQHNRRSESEWGGEIYFNIHELQKGEHYVGENNDEK